MLTYLQRNVETAPEGHLGAAAQLQLMASKRLVSRPFTTKERIAEVNAAEERAASEWCGPRPKMQPNVITHPFMGTSFTADDMPESDGDETPTALYKSLDERTTKDGPGSVEEAWRKARRFSRGGRGQHASKQHSAKAAERSQRITCCKRPVASKASLCSVRWRQRSSFVMRRSTIAAYVVPRASKSSVAPRRTVTFLSWSCLRSAIQNRARRLFSASRI